MLLPASRRLASVLKKTVAFGTRSQALNSRTLATMSAQQNISFPSSNAAGDGQGALFGDPQKSPMGLILIHEWWGLNPQIQQEGSEIAAQGNFSVIVPDFYRGKQTDDREEAGHLMQGLDWPGALLDISGAAKYLMDKGCLKVGVTGRCMGGALSLAAAAKCPEVSASAPFYGIPGPDLADLTTIKIPVQGHFGEKDDLVGFSSPKDYSALQDKLKNAGVQFELFTYDAGHAFTNSSGPNYNKEAATTAISRMCEFMQKNLKA